MWNCISLSKYQTARCFNAAIKRQLSMNGNELLTPDLGAIKPWENVFTVVLLDMLPILALVGK